MKINIIWGDYVVYDHGIVDISENIGEVTIDINNSSGEKISELVIDCTLKNIVTLPTLSRDAQYDIEIDDGLVTAESDLPSEDPEPERDGIKISELPSTSTLQQDDLFALSRDDGSNGSYDRTLHVTLTDLIAAINPAVTYTLTVNGVTGGTVTPLVPENYQEGTAVTAGITVDSEYNFVSWTSNWPGLPNPTNSQLSFNMPAQDVTLTPVLEIIDPTDWTDFEMYNAGSLQGFSPWDPTDLKWTNLIQKTNNSSDFPIFYYSDSSESFYSMIRLQNSPGWLTENLSNSNYSNLRVEYIDSNDNVVNDVNGSPMSYTGTELTQPLDPINGAFINWNNGSVINPEKLGLSNATPEVPQLPYVGIEFTQSYNAIRIRITDIAANQNTTSSEIYVYSHLDPTFGWDN